jgi:phage anti-repressor protein
MINGLNVENIKNYDNEQPTVLCRDLHKALGVKNAYKNWFKRIEKQCDYMVNG